MCNALEIKDPFQVYEDIKREGLKVDKDDVNIIFTSVIGCVPGVGPLLQGVFALFWKRASPSDSVSKAELDKKMEELKKEMIGIIDSKIKDSEIRMWTDICQTVLWNLRSSCTSMKIDLSALIYKLDNNETITTDFLTDIRTKITLALDHSTQLLNFCSNPKYMRYVVRFYIESLFTNISIYGLINAFWYQLNYDEIYIAGRKPNRKSPKGVKSNNEKLHDLIMEGLALIGYHANPDDRYDSFEKNAHLLLKSDVFMYPVPLIMYEPGEQENKEYESELPEGDDKVPNRVINLPTKPMAYIMRMDAYYVFTYQMDPRISQSLGNRDGWIEPITGCLGKNFEWTSLRSYDIKLDEPRNITIRLYGHYLNYVKSIDLEGTDGSGKPFRETLDVTKYQYGALRPPAQRYNHRDNSVYKAGYAVSKQFKQVKEMTFKFSIDAIMCHLLFIEFMVTLNQDQYPSLVEQQN
ncbi:hypothetical protein SAMD00019534_092820 [Acytostelium subglobosum LB1]|uniref:hypothetical protein n=1 Tax=Acytostelium subglobosum LB1 TaxID=1410327 RepID=UPI000644D363|nr:hypothetical protein SAMD00019534_092820 [Acytostelium subglobosum LB1]GAM26107.1 hypothetical protein SAMD00019534_092820 [Acytostelium subglobosum LB1]|eukprot:XP_012751150.1 hypothetical protein SAMD00019534_092820 [Acytostelium subglobosum LB1]